MDQLWTYGMLGHIYLKGNLLGPAVPFTLPPLRTYVLVMIIPDFRFFGSTKKRRLHNSLRLIFAWQRPILAGSDPPTTFGALKLNFCVRHGNRCIIQAIITTLWKLVLSKLNNILCLTLQVTTPLRLSPRPISNGPLHASPHFHFHPIYLIISEGSYFLNGMGNLIWRRVSHLDAFSVYLIHT